LDRKIAPCCCSDGVVGDINSIVSKRDQCLEEESILLIQVYTTLKQTQDFQGIFVNKWKKIINMMLE
jgi:hypothetical protein